MTDTPTTPEELAATLRREYDNADNFYSTLEGYQSQAFDYYEAKPFGNEVEGRSQIVLPDVQEAIDGMASSVLRTFVSGERTIEFEAECKEDELAAEEATEAVNYQFMRKQDGYRVLHDGCVDGLLRKTGIFKTTSETVEKVSRQRVVVDPIALEMLGGDTEVEDVEENEDGTVTATIKETRVERVFRDYAVPPSEFRFSPSARHEDESDYLCHVREVTRSDLVEMGFDREQAEGLSGLNSTNLSDHESDLDNHHNEESTLALENVLLCEEYAHIDVDGDGIAERVMVYRVENEILIDAETGEPSIETVDEQPFSVFCPFPRPHRIVGYSLADKMMDVQLHRSFIGRQLFDGLALSNMPRHIVDENSATQNTYQDILTPIPGSPIRVKGGANSVQVAQTSFDPSKSLQVIEWISREKEARSHIGRATPGLDENTLNNLTATEFQGRASVGELGQEFIARNLAETMSRLFLKKYRLMRSEGEPFRIKVDGQYKEVDPSQWPEDICMNVRVGLGSGSKDKRVQARMALLGPLMNAIEQGLAGPEHAFTWMDGMARDTGVGQGDDFMFDPSNPDTQPPQENETDPETEAKMLELQGKQQEAQARLELDQQKAASQIELERLKAQANVDATREKAELDMQLSRERAAQEAQLARESMIMEAQLEREKMALTGAQDANMDQNRAGGRLDA